LSNQEAPPPPLVRSTNHTQTQNAAIGTTAVVSEHDLMGERESGLTPNPKQLDLEADVSCLGSGVHSKDESRANAEPAVSSPSATLILTSQESCIFSLSETSIHSEALPVATCSLISCSRSRLRGRTKSWSILWHWHLNIPTGTEYHLRRLSRSHEVGILSCVSIGL
jgi:hypothetical protein